MSTRSSTTAASFPSIAPHAVWKSGDNSLGVHVFVSPSTAFRAFVGSHVRLVLERLGVKDANFLRHFLLEMLDATVGGEFSKD